MEGWTGGRLPRLLIVNADDFGISPGVNRGILEAHRRGILTSTTAMANMPSFQEAAAIARENPSLDVGVHLNLTSGHPVLPPEQVLGLLGPEGRFLRADRLLARLSLGRLELRQAEAEMNAQVERAMDAGIWPSHLDTHHHLHLHPALQPMAVRVALRHGIRGIRTTVEMGRAEMASRAGMLTSSAPVGKEKARGVYGKAVILSVLGMSLRKRARWAGLATPCRFRGLLLGLAFSGDALRQTLMELPEGATELMCHPGYPDEELARQTSYGPGRDAELRALLDPAARSVLEEAGVRLGRYSDLPS